MGLADFSVFIREQYTSDATFAPLENRIWFENSANGCRKYWILYLKQIENPRLFSVLLLSTYEEVECFPLHFFPSLPLPACLTTEQSPVDASLFVNYISIFRVLLLYISIFDCTFFLYCIS